MRMRKWLRERLNRMPEEVNVDAEEEVLNTGYTLKTIKDDNEKREKDLSRLETEIEHHLERYKELMEKAAELSGITRTSVLSDAKDEKMQAAEKQESHSILLNEYMTLRRAVSKHLAIKTRKGTQNGEYEVSFEEIDTEGMKKAAEEEKVQKQKRQENRRQVEREMDIMSEDVEVDFDDVEKTVSELEQETQPDGYGVENEFVAGEEENEDEVERVRQPEPSPSSGSGGDPIVPSALQEDDDDGDDDDGESGGSGAGLEGIDDTF